MPRKRCATGYKWVDGNCIPKRRRVKIKMTKTFIDRTPWRTTTEFEKGEVLHADELEINKKSYIYGMYVIPKTHAKKIR